VTSAKSATRATAEPARASRAVIASACWTGSREMLIGSPAPKKSLWKLD